ncbi:MAG: proP 1 [Gammaproteobacteria bacterium]|jgi:MFS family permease|nr:proP 1 [Gammaproteobacteria bacterium]
MQTIRPSRLVAVTTVGGCLEFFDFTIFALFSHYISRSFFPFTSELLGLINTFSIFAVGYFARPLGGLLISHIGDRYGRKKSLMLSVNLMAFATLGIALLPGYAQIGIAAPLLLLLLRCIQGAAVGGEIPGVVTYLTEYFHTQNPIFAISMVLGGVTASNLIASALGYFLSAHFSVEFMQSYGWRIPFLIGAILGLVGVVIRKYTQETAIFIGLLASRAIYRVPMKIVFQQYGLRVLLGAAMTALTSATIFIFLYLPVFVQTILKQTNQNAFLLSSVGFAALSFFTILWGRKNANVFLGCVGAILVVSTAGFWAFSTHYGLIIFCIALSFFVGMVNACYPYFIGQLFPSEVRYTGIASAYNLGVAFFGALAPVVLMNLYKIFRAVYAPLWFLGIASLFTLFALILRRRIK